MADSLKKVDPAKYGRGAPRVGAGLRVQYCWSAGAELANKMKDTNLARSLLQKGMEQADPTAQRATAHCCRSIAITRTTHAQNGFLSGYWCNRVFATVASERLGQAWAAATGA
jgi:hypothetical protein